MLGGSLINLLFEIYVLLGLYCIYTWKALIISGLSRPKLGIQNLKICDAENVFLAVSNGLVKNSFHVMKLTLQLNQ